MNDKPNNNGGTRNRVAVQQLFVQAAKTLRSEFDAIGNIPHPLYRGLDREAILREFLKVHLPQRFSVGSGFIVDTLGEASHQADVLIYDAENSPVYHHSPNALILDRDTVPIVIEVKSRLTKGNFLKCIEDAKAVKSLAQSIKQFDRVVLMGDSGNEVIRGGGTEIMYVIFAYESALALRTILELWREHYADTDFGLQIDFVTVLDKGIVQPAVWHPGIGMPEGSLQPVCALPPLRMTGKEVHSRMLFPRVDVADDSVTIKVGSPSFFPPGTKFFLSYTEYGDLTLDWFFRTVLQYLSYYVELMQPSVPHLSNDPTLRHTIQERGVLTRFAPLGVCVEIDEGTLSVVDKDVMIERVRELLDRARKKDGE